MRAEIEKVRATLHSFGVALSDLAGKLDEIEALPGKLTHLDAEYEGKKKRLAQIDQLIAEKEAQLSELAIKTNDALAIVRGAFPKKVA
jgi:chromosome segregation ATPase